MSALFVFSINPHANRKCHLYCNRQVNWQSETDRYQMNAPHGPSAHMQHRIGSYSSIHYVEIHHCTIVYQFGKLVAGLIPILCLMMLTDATVGIASGSFDGIGKQKYSLCLCLCSVAHLVAMPSAYGLAFRRSLGLHWQFDLCYRFSCCLTSC